ncbi:MAG: ADP-forming succinate--CoA ligase subunit beta [Desulfovibrionaceae bacterium]
MNIHEYQAKELLRSYGIPVPHGRVASSPEEALAAARMLAGPLWVVKAQIHAGGRGASGGVKLCSNPNDVGQSAAVMLGMRLVTPQTGPEGKLVQKVLVEQGVSTVREVYAAVTLDRTSGRLAVVFSPNGGMDIESVAVTSPDRIRTVYADAAHHVWPFQARQLVHGCGLSAKQEQYLTSVLCTMLRLAQEKDALLVEINPLAVLPSGEFLALDAKIQVDDSAVKRQISVAAMEDFDEVHPLEMRARAQGLNYVRLEGCVGTMANGAGLAMATMDAIKQAGALPANFLDVGGGAKEETIANGLQVMLADGQVRGILVNIFGGILRCDVVAHGLARAAEKIQISLPMVVRLEGTNVEAGRRVLQESALPVVTAESMADAACKIVELTEVRA